MATARIVIPDPEPGGTWRVLSMSITPVMEDAMVEWHEDEPGIWKATRGDADFYVEAFGDRFQARRAGGADPGHLGSFDTRADAMAAFGHSVEFVDMAEAGDAEMDAALQDVHEATDAAVADDQPQWLQDLNARRAAQAG